TGAGPRNGSRAHEHANRGGGGRERAERDDGRQHGRRSSHVVPGVIIRAADTKGSGSANHRHHRAIGATRLMHCILACPAVATGPALPVARRKVRHVAAGWSNLQHTTGCVPYTIDTNDGGNTPLETCTTILTALSRSSHRVRRRCRFRRMTNTLVEGVS